MPIDTLLVRPLLVPAMSTLLGDRAWWSGFLWPTISKITPALGWSSIVSEEVSFSFLAPDAVA
ncbi:putative membrane protein YdfJ with MMPL/SSD domain [Streptomyces sp. LBL]|uniref:hypothetical protein n=1 Tax=Streptomyces sp. LBL TaxID=2940562 RepID=UPI0024755500|nr:hypothetical protein [Streptomyces sp. LBL]MDH6626115.1 putative membrane protein YdfJ with MMPL/SSD domain [Streptomyces sp. LBL]